MQTLSVLLVAALAAFTTTVHAQSRCQMWITNFADGENKKIPETRGEITRGCSLPFASNLDIGLREEGCDRLTPFEINFDEEIISSGVTGLEADVIVRLHNENLREGYVKYKNVDLNFENPDHCTQSLADDVVVFQKCQFDCP